MQSIDSFPVNRRILIVDDQAAIHSDFRKILNGPEESALEQMASELFENSAGPTAVRPVEFRLDSAMQGQEALARVQEALVQGEPYAVAFVDMRMPPGWDGMRTIREIWATDSDIEVVICTAYSDRAWQELTSSTGRRDKLLVLKKPFDSVEVHQLSIALTDKWNAGRIASWKMEELEEVIVKRTRELKIAAQHKSDFLSLLSHEFRTPLHAVIGFSQLLAAESYGALNEEQHRATRRIVDAADHLLALLQDMLDVVENASGALKLDRGLLDCAEWVNAAVADFAQDPEALRPVLELSSRAATVWADRKRCSQVLLNLLSNANKHTPRTGSITVRTGPSGSGTVKISVTDTGSGISPDDLPKMFSEFGKTAQSLREHTGGLGIGLALSRSIVQMHGGEVGVESVPGKGSTFWFTLPATR